MKKNVLKLMVVAAMIASCSDDDGLVVPPVDQVDPPVEEVVEGTVVLNEVAYLNNQVEIYNNSDATVDLDEYFLCLAPGTYRQIGALETTGNVALGAGEYLVVNYDMPNEIGGLGLYSNNDDFTDAANIVDFVQWGDANTARENVAVDANLWTAGEFVSVVNDADNSIIFDGEGNGVSNWAETTSVTLGAENELMVPMAQRRSIVFNEVQYGTRNLIELYNNGDIAIDLAPYWLCLGPGEYSQIGNLTPESGDISLEPGELVVLNPTFTMDDSEGLGLYSSQAFTDADALIDFVQWGSSGSARENVAVEANQWTAGDFVPTVTLAASSIEYDGEGDASTDWAEESDPSLGFTNDAVSAKTTFNIKITNVTNYLNAHVFNTPVGASGPGRLVNVGDQYQITFQAVPGTRFTPATMMFNSNDWFLAPTDLAGINLWENGVALNGVDIADQLSLYDSGTEADNDPANFPPAGPNVGPADTDTNVRLVEGRTTTASDYITAVLDYTPGNGSSAGTFTFTITAKLAAGMPFAQDNGFGITPGIVVLHALPEPLFTLGQPDRGLGLEEIAENGNPSVLYNWLKEEGSTGAPLRLSSTLSVFSPGLVYAFNSTSDPLVLQGQVNPTGNGLEELAEDGNNAVAVDYLNGLGLPVAASAETTNQGPGGELNFTLEVPQGQGYKLGFSTMFVQTNDWFISYNNAGFPLWDENGVAVSGTGASTKSYLYDAGTEVDQAVGFGADQAPRQGGPNAGSADGNNLVRRVGALEDVQFGKGLIESPAGVVYLEDPRGGYNVIRVEVQPQ